MDERSDKGFRKLIVWQRAHHQEEYDKGEALRAETGFLLHRLEQSLKHS